ncbi:MAG: DUF4845 domain-containing protein [Nevskiales bacterium]|nr:DUF4845 domain-containing protein [Nevskiales bacterium]
MQYPSQQRGLGLWGWIFVLGVIGGVTLVALRLVPFYFNELAIMKSVRTVAQNPGNSQLSAQELRKILQKHWSIEGITTLRVDEIRVASTANGRVVSYDYEVRAPLLYNLSIVAHFQNEFLLKGGGPAE